MLCMTKFRMTLPNGEGKAVPHKEHTVSSVSAHAPSHATALGYWSLSDLPPPPNLPQALACFSWTQSCAVKQPSISSGGLFCKPSPFVLLPNDNLHREYAKLLQLRLDRASARKPRFIAPLAAAGGIQSQNVSYLGSFLTYDTLWSTQPSPRCWERTT